MPSGIKIVPFSSIYRCKDLLGITDLLVATFVDCLPYRKAGTVMFDALQIPLF